MLYRKIFRLRLPNRKQPLLLGQRTLLMGVLNITPDSFSDGGKFLTPSRAVQHALALEKAGADILDIGAESTRPGSEGISVAEELRRLLPVLQALRGKLKLPISIDTRKSAVAEIALGAGAQIINDVSGLKHDPRIAEIAAAHNCPLILMHMRGQPGTMQNTAFAKNVLQDVTKGLRTSIAVARTAGVAKSQIILDPGIGFGKSFAQNYELLQKLPDLAKLGYPLMIGTSRKGFLGATLASAGHNASPSRLHQSQSKPKPIPADQRLFATAATVTASILV